MAGAQEKNPLEGARARLEQALSRLTQEVASSRSALELAQVTQQEAAEIQTAHAERMQKLEQENLRLHEQIATLSLQAPAEKDIEQVKSLEAEKSALQQNYDLLKRQYTSLQDEFEGLQNRMDIVSPESTATGDDGLRQQVADLGRERDEIRSELDTAIAELEGYLATSAAAAGGMN